MGTKAFFVIFFTYWGSILTHLCPNKNLWWHYYQDNYECLWLSSSLAMDVHTAASACANDAINGEIFIADNQSVHDYVLNLTSSALTGSFWINYNQTTGSRLNGSDVSFQLSSFAMGSGGCVAQDHVTGTWSSVSCEDLFLPLCSLKLTSCSHDDLETVYLAEQNLCYYVPQTMSLDTKQVWKDVCANYGGYLAVLLDKTLELSHPNWLQTKFGTSGIWLGYNDIETEGLYITDDCYHPTWMDWRSDQPNDPNTPDKPSQDCVLMYAIDNRGEDFSWQDKNCGEKHYGLCYKNFGDTPRVCKTKPSFANCSSASNPYLRCGLFQLETQELSPPLIYQPISEQYGFTASQCGVSCITQYSCLSYTYNKTNTLCRLYDAVYESNPVELEEMIYYKRIK